MNGKTQLETNGNESSLTDSASESGAKTICCQAGYLPVPLRCVPEECLKDMDIYLANKDEYLLYSSTETPFSRHDLERLLESGVEFVYVSIRDHQTYYRTMEQAIEKIVDNPHLKREKKSEILYATSIELSNQLLVEPPGRKEIDRAAHIAKATVNMIMNDTQAFSSLFEVFNHDFYTASHMVNVCALTVTTATKLGIDTNSELHRIGTGGLLHDIGKIFIRPELLNKTGGLSAEEFEHIKQHVTLGKEHLHGIAAIPTEVIQIVSEHHERMDGSGYPRGLKGVNISPLGRLAGIVDSFDAMTSVRPYREHTFTVEEALKELSQLSPTKYDCEMVHAFKRLIQSSLKRHPDQSSEHFKLDTEDSLTSRHLHYYFRIPTLIKRIRKQNGAFKLSSPEQVIAHKLSCVSIGWLSDKPFEPDENVVISGSKFREMGLDRLLAVVCGCKAQQGGWYTIEARFHRELIPEITENIKTITSVREVSSLNAGTEHTG